jgi:Dehydrogenases with different specificities (related to short-chain alcohol dehydrogenases)
MKFTGRKALVTGSATGLGRLIALKLAEGGADVIVNASRSAEAAEATAAEIRAVGREAVVAIADVSDRQGAETLARTAAPWGRLDILVNNAGVTRHAPDYADLDALSAQDWHDVYGVNVVGPWLVMQACKDLLLKGAAAAGRPAAVLNTSSIASMRPVGSSIAYAASKAALNAMTLYLARGLAPDIRVNAVCPGFIGTRWARTR